MLGYRAQAMFWSNLVITSAAKRRLARASGMIASTACRRDISAQRGSQKHD